MTSLSKKGTFREKKLRYFKNDFFVHSNDSIAELKVILMVIIGHESWMMSHFRSNLTQRSFEVISRLIMNPRSVQLLDDGWFVSFEWPDRLLLLKNHSLLVPIRCVDEAILHNHHPPKNSSIKKIFKKKMEKNFRTRDKKLQSSKKWPKWKIAQYNTMKMVI